MSYFSKNWYKKKGGMEEEGNVIPRIVEYARRGRVEKMVLAVEELGEPINSTDSYQHSALFHAALNGHKKCLKELLKRGADPNQADAEGLTPCHAVALSGKIPRGMQDDYENYINNYSSSSTTEEEDCCCTEALSSLVPNSMQRPRSQRRCLEYLVQYGGDLKKCTYQQQETTKDIAIRRGKTSVVDMINEYYILQAGHDGSTEVLFPPAQNTLWMHSTPPRINHETAGSIPELKPQDVEKVAVYPEFRSVDGSVWSRGVWSEGVQVTLRQIARRRDRKTAIEGGAQVMCVEHFLKEMDNLRDMRHPQLVLLMAVCTGPRQQDMFLAMEILQTGCLYSMLHKQHRKFSQSEAVGILSDITSAVAYLHNIQEVAHNVLSSHAICLSPKAGAKLCNLFCCQPPSTQLPGLCSPALRLFLPWMAPELMQTRIAAIESDIFSLGVLLWEVWSGTPPWPGLSPPQLGRVLIHNGQRLPLNNNHILIAPILKTCFGPPVARLPAAQLLSQINYIKMTRFTHF